MKKEFGKWLMDIAKYVVTAVILSSVFTKIEEGKTVYITGSLFVIILVIFGLILQKESPEKKKKRR
jgi:L-asparagine transporter-like permease